MAFMTWPEYEITSVPFEMARFGEIIRTVKKDKLFGRRKKESGCFFSYRPRNQDSIRSTAQDHPMSNLSVTDPSSVESLMRHLTDALSAIPEIPTWPYRDVHRNKICFE